MMNDDLHVKVGHTRPRTLTLEIPQATVEGSRNSDVISRWRNDWQSATVVNSSLVEDPTIWLRFRPSPASVVTAESFSNGSGPLQCVPQEMGFHWQRTMCLWWNPNNVAYRQRLSIDQVWRQTTASIWNRWSGRQLADNMAPSIRQQRSCSSKVESDYTRASEVCSSSTIASLVGSHARSNKWRTRGAWMPGFREKKS